MDEYWRGFGQPVLHEPSTAFSKRILSGDSDRYHRHALGYAERPRDDDEQHRQRHQYDVQYAAAGFIAVGVYGYDMRLFGVLADEQLVCRDRGVGQ